MKRAWIKKQGRYSSKTERVTALQRPPQAKHQSPNKSFFFNFLGFFLDFFQLNLQQFHVDKALMGFEFENLGKIVLGDISLFTYKSNYILKS